MTHRNGFTFLRLTAAFLVLLTHSYVVLGRPSEPFADFTHLVAFSTLGVDCFFAISGFLITASLYRTPSAFAYLRSRALRILPGLAFVVGVSVFLLGPVLTQDAGYWSNRTTYGYLLNATLYVWRPFLPGVFASNPVTPVNGSIWTLPHEATCYLMLLLISWCGALNWRGLSVIAAVSLGLYVQGVFAPHEYFGTLELPYLNRFCSLFLCGAVVFAVQERFHLPWHLLGLASFALVAAAFLLGQKDWHYFALPYLVGWPVFVISVAFLGTRLSWINRYDFSYGFYLFGFPVQQCVVSALGKGVPVLELMLISTVVTLACAAVSWFLVERPALSLKGSRTPQRPAALPRPTPPVLEQASR